MEAFKSFIWILNIFAALSIIILILMQHGKGADAGAAFGAGSAQGVFGSAGSANFLSRSTSIFAVVFFVTCLMLAMMSSNRHIVVQQTSGLPASTQPATGGEGGSTPVPAQDPKPAIPE